jgi:hypothetical protein
VIVAATRAGAAHELDRVGGGDVLEHDAQPREVAQQRRQLAVEEHALAVEHVDVGVRDLAVQQQRHVVPFHRRERTARLRQSVTPFSELVVAPAG